MKKMQHGKQSRYTVTLENGAEVYLSYRAIVGVKTPAGDIFATSAKYSVTTSKHMGTRGFWLNSAPALEQRALDNLAYENGFSPAYL